MKLAVISDVTFELVLKQISKDPQISIEKYAYADQIIPELHSIESGLQSIDLLIVHFDSYFYRYSDQYVADILNKVRSMAGNFTGNILISNNVSNGRHGSILKTNIGQQDQILLELNEAIKGILQTSNVYFYDVRKLITRIGLQHTYNFKLGFLYQMPYTKDFISQLSEELISLIHFLSRPEKKAIFVDCDNTLWQGILGEDGIESIQCDRNAKGVLFFQFQEFLLEKKKEGFILGLCSKNNEADVKEAFDKLNMPLKWNDFLIKKVNWLNKTDNLKQAATELNIGLDSFIFVDDNEFELQSIQSISPEISTIKLENNYDAFLLLTDNYAFKRKRLTSEDLLKNEQYIAEQQRNEAKASVQSFEEYLASLEIRMDITKNNKADLPRLSQLTEKTNQFNFYKEPFSINALDQFIEEGNLTYGLRVADKFGDYGLVGLILMEVHDKEAIQRNFLMSCRALGRQIEHEFMEFVLADLRKEGIGVTEVRFKDTAKNAPAKTFLEQMKKEKTTV